MTYLQVVKSYAASKLVFLIPAGADKKAEAGAGSATEFQFVSVPHAFSMCIHRSGLNPVGLQVVGM